MSAPESILFPGPDGWELWRYPQKSAPQCDRDPSDKAVSAAPRLLLALPTRSLVAVPLWISAEGDALELAGLELSARHLLRRDAEVRVVPVESAQGRSLVLALAVGNDSPAAPWFGRASAFDFPAHLIDPGGADLVIWKESGTLCAGFYRSGKCVAFSSSGEPAPGPAFCGMVSRLALRLRAEEIVTGLPSSIRLIGPFSVEERETLASSFRAAVELVSPQPAPVLPAQAVDIAPPAARRQRERRDLFKRLSLIGGVAAAVYVLILAVLSGDLVVKSLQLKQLNAEVASSSGAFEEAQKLVGEWKEFESSVNPEHFALDQLAAVASELPGEQVRLTSFTLENGRLIIAGEAADISQAYQFLERVKKSPVLQQYDWTSRQPQLAGKNKVRFEMEGARPDAKTRDE